MKMPKTQAKKQVSTRNGFTIVEVMLALAISGLLLVGVLGGTYSSISHQRYTDALRNFAEYVRTVYSEAISPQSLGLGNSSNHAILGKVVVFGSEAGSDNTVYSATIIGRASIPLSQNKGFIEELADPESQVQLFCGDASKDPDDKGYNSTVTSYTMLWQTELRQAGVGNINNKFSGTLIIARPLTSALVHTAFLKDITYNLKDHCTPSDHAASIEFGEGLRIHRAAYEESLKHDTSICIKSDDAAITREVRIAADGHNTSAVLIVDDEESQCR